MVIGPTVMKICNMILVLKMFTIQKRIIQMKIHIRSHNFYIDLYNYLLIYKTFSSHLILPTALRGSQGKSHVPIVQMRKLRPRRDSDLFKVNISTAFYQLLL